MFVFSSTIVRSCIKYVGLFLYGGCVHQVVTHNFSTVIKCQQKSMYPTINKTSEDDYVVIKIASSHHGLLALKKEDVIVLKHPNNPEQLICKRIKLVGGDKLTESSSLSSSVVPRGHVWVEGDNPLLSSDSRTFGPIPLGLVMGKVTFRVWPLSQIGWIN